jgi:endonuclease G, mitochondrial
MFGLFNKLHFIQVSDMAKFRTYDRGHQRKHKSSDFFRIVLLICIAGGLIYFLLTVIKKDSYGLLSQNQENAGYTVPASTEDPDTRFFLPTGSRGKIIHHSFYSMSYFEKYEIPEWVAYELTKKNLVAKNVERTDWFNEDLSVPTGSATYYDYSGSGFDRGHMVPAADMAFSREAMEESFLMSNMVPKVPAFNNGIWRELEENVRDWAYKNKRLYIVSGPVLSKGISRKIGKKNRIGVPNYLFKAILDLEDPELKSIAFIIENQLSTRRLSTYAVSIDSLEALTGLDLFAELMSVEQQKTLESGFNLNQWPLSEKKYNLRLSSWNNQQR